MIVFAGREGREAKYVVGSPEEPDEDDGEEKFMNEDSGASDREDVETCRRRIRSRMLAFAMLMLGSRRGWWCWWVRTRSLVAWLVEAGGVRSSLDECLEATSIANPRDSRWQTRRDRQEES